VKKRIPTPGSEKPRKKHGNLEERRRLKASRIADFEKAVGRKAQKGREPNDRRYDHDLAKKLRRMKPEEIDFLLREDERDDG